ncbi:Maf family protein [Jiulongibacter sp. NS-SX5]|uniref:Maf family protein n=1 Tax=Jiulongibacter sp. NS-SX5 TaxID=3463854 RepID=UPI00405995C5
MKLTKSLILGSGSPRRKEIMENAGFRFEIEVKPTDEAFSDEMKNEDVAAYLALQKISEFDRGYDDQIVMCADTVVIVDGKIMNKPADENEAFEMLSELSAKTHKVVTGVAIQADGKRWTFSDECLVSFEELSKEEKEYYIKTCKPFDKAGSYGIQDFIGMAKISKLNGSFYTVMGLPIHKVYQELEPYIIWK